MEKKMFQAKVNQNKAEIGKIVSVKVDFRAKILPGIKEGHLIMIKGSIHWVDIRILNVYVSNKRTSQYKKQNLTNWKKK